MPLPKIDFPNGMFDDYGNLTDYGKNLVDSNYEKFSDEYSELLESLSKN